jgi:multidrug transporter EmrE-like cation transporter
MKDVRMGSDFAFSFALGPWSLLALAFGAAGFLYLQKALYTERVAYVVPIVSALSIVTPVVMSAVLLDEYVSLMNWIGLWLILVGVIGIGKGEWDEGLIASLMKRVRVSSGK